MNGDGVSPRANPSARPASTKVVTSHVIGWFTRSVACFEPRDNDEDRPLAQSLRRDRFGPFVAITSPARAAFFIVVASSGSACCWGASPNEGGGGTLSSVVIVGWNNVERKPSRAANERPSTASGPAEPSSVTWSARPDGPAWPIATFVSVPGYPNRLAKSLNAISARHGSG